MKFKRDYLNQAEGNVSVKNWIEANLENHLKKEKLEENVTEIEHIIDYLKSDKAPKNIHKMSYEEAKNNSEKWAKALIKNAGDIVETEEDSKVIKKFRSGVKLVQLVGRAAYEREGKIMRHCVASYYGKNDVSIYSLRDENNRPHCTIEVVKSNNEINQIKGKGNGKIHPRYIKYVLKVLPAIGMQIRENDMQYLGYEKLDKNTMSFIEKNFEGIQEITFLNKRFFYLGSNLKRK